MFCMLTLVSSDEVVVLQVKISCTPLRKHDSSCHKLYFFHPLWNGKCNWHSTLAQSKRFNKTIICSDKFVKAINISPGTSSKNYDASVSISAKMISLLWEKGLQFFMTADNNDERHALSGGWRKCNIFIAFGLTFPFCHGYGQWGL